MIAWLRGTAKSLLAAAIGDDTFVWRLRGPKAGVALTFDDGPDPVHTPKLLDLLARLDVRATFFVRGDAADRHPDIVRRIVADGHAIASHTWDHRDLPGRSPDDLAQDLARCRRALREIAGVDTRLFRPPRGRMDPRSVRTIAALGYRIVHWGVTYADYRRDGLEPLLARMRARPPRSGDIVLLHDHNDHTIEALARLVPDWRSRGLVFETIGQPARR
jgi:peptidoglycan/xylan/chitin deacetylase (PgdA/CDA1 family)